MLALSLVAMATIVATASSLAPRRVRVDGQRFITAADNATIVLAGPNVVVKAHPYLPTVAGTAHCHDLVNATCAAAGNCESCTTFNEADVALLKSQRRNFIRLGVVWAGAQPDDADRLDPAFEARLHAILNLTDATGIHVMLDNHGDMVGSAGCGNGAPMWFQRKAAPELIGKPLVTGFPYSLIGALRVDKVGGYDHCGSDASKWAQHAGDPNYNLLNECCLAMNGGNPGGLGYTTVAQATMEYNWGAGQPDFVRYWTLIAEAVKDHPSAFAIELANEPMSINREGMYNTWRAVSEAVVKIVPDMTVAIADTGEGAVLPGWVDTLLDLVPLPFLAPSASVVKWLKDSNNLFYAWHWYGSPSRAGVIKNVQDIMKDWDMPSFVTETMDCGIWNASNAAGISHSYWHYSCYCNTGSDFGNRSVPDQTFGGCMLGWGAGDEARCM